MFQQTLYGLNKDQSFKTWTITAMGDSLDADLTITHGKEGGKQVEKVENFTGGKQGRDAVGQAVFEAQARVKKQMDKGYRATKEELNEIPIIAMLAKDYLKAGHQVDYSQGVLLSDKLDGVRCLAKCTGPGVVTLESRTGQPYNVPHITEELAKTMRPGEILDGEIYVHGPSLQDITSAVKREDADEKVNAAYLKVAKLTGVYESKRDAKWHTAMPAAKNALEEATAIRDLRNSLEFWVFDLVQLNAPFEDRLSDLETFFIDRQPSSVLVKVHYDVALSEEEMKEAHADAVRRGFEGIMIRTMNGLYESGKRSSGLYKFKVFMDAEFLILDIVPDKQGDGVFVLQNDLTDDTFQCVMGTLEQRANTLRNKHRFIGLSLKVKFQARYKGTLLPQFPVGLMLREGTWEYGVFIPAE